MQKVFFLALLGLGVNAMSSTATCKWHKDRIGTSLMKTSAMTIQYSEDYVYQITGKTKKKMLLGSFSKMAKNGSYMYKSDAMLKMNKGASFANIFIEPAMIDGYDGTIAFSIGKQDAKDAPVTWSTDRFDCIVVKTKK